MTEGGMKNQGRVHGRPLIPYQNTKANIEALTGLTGGETAYATDNPSAPFGEYNVSDGLWHWSNNDPGGGTTTTTIIHIPSQPGEDGEQGVPGRQGVDGAAGATGATGATGSTGATGPIGPAGVNGAMGTPGADGEDGDRIILAPPIPLEFVYAPIPAAVIADNAVVRGDGGVKGIQGSPMSVDDSGNATGLISLDIIAAVAAAFTMTRDGGQNSIQLTSYGSLAAQIPQLLLRRSRNTLGTPNAVQSGDILGRVGGTGYDTSTFPALAAMIDAIATETWSTTARGADFRFLATAKGGTATGEKGRITGQGNLLVGTATDPTGGGTPVLVMAQASGNPTGPPANSAGAFAKDVAGTCEFFSFDEAGNVNQTSSHPADAPDWMYDSTPGAERFSRTENIYTGVIKWVNESRRDELYRRTIEGEKLPKDELKRKFQYEESYADYNKRMNANYIVGDWEENQEANRAHAEQEIAIWNKSVKDLEAYKIEYEKHMDAVKNFRPRKVGMTEKVLVGLGLKTPVTESAPQDDLPHPDQIWIGERPKEFIYKPMPEFIKQALKDQKGKK